MFMLKREKIYLENYDLLIIFDTFSFRQKYNRPYKFPSVANNAVITEASGANVSKTEKRMYIFLVSCKH